ncbi:hypothetical protein LJB42_003649 [Komagataella kurtzmanii]|nr:hypothetical protein LJB42_003649 [Komagataella kurtzmanii]
MRLSYECLLSVFLVLAYHLKGTKATPPACVLECVSVVSNSCPKREADTECLCAQKDSIIGCLVDICKPLDFSGARDHVNKTCLNLKEGNQHREKCQLNHEHDDSCGGNLWDCKLNHKHNDTCARNNPWNCDLEHQHNEFCGKKDPQCELNEDGICRNNSTNTENNLEVSLQLEDWDSDSDDESFEDISEDSSSDEESTCSDEADSDCDSEYDPDEYEPYGYRKRDMDNPISKSERPLLTRSKKQLDKQLKPSAKAAHANPIYPFKDKIPIQSLPKLNKLNPVSNGVENSLESLL